MYGVATYQRRTKTTYSYSGTRQQDCALALQCHAFHLDKLKPRNDSNCCYGRSIHSYKLSLTAGAKEVNAIKLHQFKEHFGADWLMKAHIFGPMVKYLFSIRQSTTSYLKGKQTGGLMTYPDTD